MSREVARTTTKAKMELPATKYNRRSLNFVTGSSTPESINNHALIKVYAQDFVIFSHYSFSLQVLFLTYTRGVPSTQANIQDRAFCKKR